MMAYLYDVQLIASVGPFAALVLAAVWWGMALPFIRSWRAAEVLLAPELERAVSQRGGRHGR